MLEFKKRITGIFALLLSISISIPVCAKPNPRPGDTPSVINFNEYYCDDTFRKAGSKGGYSIEGVTIKVMQMPLVGSNLKENIPLEGVDVYWTDSVNPAGITNEEGIWINPDIIPVERHTIVLKGKDDYRRPVSVSYTVNISIGLAEPIILIWPYRDDPSKTIILKDKVKKLN